MSNSLPCGGGIAVADCDTSTTWQRITHWKMYLNRCILLQGATDGYISIGSLRCESQGAIGYSDLHFAITHAHPHRCSLNRFFDTASYNLCSLLLGAHDGCHNTGAVDGEFV